MTMIMIGSSRAGQSFLSGPGLSRFEPWWLWVERLLALLIYLCVNRFLKVTPQSACGCRARPAGRLLHSLRPRPAPEARSLLVELLLAALYLYKNLVLELGGVG